MLDTVVKKQHSADREDRGKVRETALDNACPICGKPAESCPLETRVFEVQNLDCANCAAKMEERISKLPRISDVSLTYTTKQLRVTCPHPDSMRLQFQDVCRTVDDAVCVIDGEQAAEEKGESCSEDVSDEGGKPDTDVICIAVSAVLFAVGIALENIFTGVPAAVRIAVFLVAYLVAGGEVLLQAARNIGKGQVFDENFLMSIATFGAIGVQQYPEAVGVMLFYRIGELFEDRAVERSRNQIMDAVDMRPETVNRLIEYAIDRTEQAQDGTPIVESAHARKTETVDAKIAVRGDYLLIKPGERIPLDGTVVEGASRVDTSPVTGEPVPVAVSTGSSVISGCVNESGMLVMQVEKPLSESMVTRILDSVENASANKPQMQRFITRFAKVYTPVVIAIAVATAIIPSIVTGEWAHWVYTACTFLVISCPCAIVLSVPLSFFAGIGAASKLGILFKGGNSIEALKNVRAVVMDKTGTITKGTFSVQSISTAAGFTESDVLQAAAGSERFSTHPIAASILEAAAERGIEPGLPAHVEELAGKGIIAHYERPEGFAVQCGNAALLKDAGIEADIGDGAVLGGTVVMVAIGGRYAGSIRIADEPKPEAAQAIADIKAKGIKTIMLTGDARDAAQAIARQVGVDAVRAHLLPEQKLEALYDIREKFGAVMFVGDGINDAPVLAGADVGAAMGSGSDAAIEASDVMFMTSSLGAVPQSMRIAAAVAAIALQNIVFALVVKIAVMVLGFVGLASMWAAVFADVGVCMICILNSIRILRKRF